MSNRKSTNALTRDLLMQIIRYQRGMSVNVEGGIGSKNPHLVRLIEDGLVKLVRRGATRTVMSTAKHVGRNIRRTVAIAADGVKIDKVVCPSCGQLCSDDNPNSNYPWVRERHKFDCVVRTDHLYDGWNRAQEVRNTAKGRPTNVGDKTFHDTRRGKRRDKKRAKLKAARVAAILKKYPVVPEREITLVVTYE